MARLLILSLIAALCVTACQSAPPPAPTPSQMNRWSVQSYYQDMREAGIIAEHTFWPHYFIDDSAQMNELGQRAADILAAHYRDYPGTLNVRSGGVSAELYAQRVAVVRQAMVDAGVDGQALQIADDDSGGPGMASTDVADILEKGGDESSGDKSTSSSSSSKSTKTER